VVVAVALVLGLPEDARGQWKLGGGLNLEGEVEAGVRLLPDEPSDSRRGKFEEYRDITEGLFLPNLRLRLFTEDERYWAELGGSKWGQEDQEFSLEGGRLGLWEAGFSWDQIPHIYSTTARLLATESAPGVLTLPTPRPNLFAHNTADRLDEVSQRWDTARVFFTLTPTPDLDLHVQWTRIKKDGDRPFGVAMSSPGGNFYEVLEPIDQTIHELRLAATLAREQWQIQGAYTFSLFDNSLKSLVVDNPCFGLTAALAAGGCAGDATGAQRTSLMSLAPDNMAHTLSLAGGVNLPMRTRINANVSYSLRLQDESFVAHTINPAISNAALALPQNSLDGMVGIFLLNVQASTRPLRPLTLTAKYRLFDYHDTSDEPILDAHVVNDRTLALDPRQPHRFSYTKQNADVDAKWRFGPPLAVTIGGGWERWDRVNHREVPTSDEFYGKAALDVTPTDWFLGRLTYKPSFRRIDDYITTAHASHVVVEELTPSDIAQGQSFLLRKYDEADRDRQRVDLMLQFFPTNAFTATVSGSARKDDYIDSPLGLQDATGWSAGLDLGWTPLERVAFSAGYVHEEIYEKQRSRSRPVTGSTTFDFPDFDWISNNTDTIDTFHVGATVGVIPKVLDFSIGTSYSYALGRVETRNPGTLTSGTAAQRETARAKRFPAFEDQLLRIDTGLRYYFWKAWSASLGYAYETFQKNDWRTDRLSPFLPGISSSIWLGNDARNYDAHIVTLTLGYRFR
jgi:MtrB/PioB family decaheme-associated outer membrane protein